MGLPQHHFRFNLAISELDRLAKARVDFAFESTLSGLTYLRRLKRWKTSGYVIEIVYLRISSPRLALRRIANRVKQGGHNVPRSDMIRRFTRSQNISKSSIVWSPIGGVCMTTPVCYQSFWNRDHEKNQSPKRNPRIFRGCRSRTAPSRQRCAQDRTYVRHAGVRLEKWQSGGGKALACSRRMYCLESRRWNYCGEGTPLIPPEDLAG